LAGNFQPIEKPYNGHTLYGTLLYESTTEGDMADGKVKVTVNLPEEQVKFLQEVSAKDKISFTDALRRAIRSEEFFVEQESNNRKVLVEDKDKIREVIRK
jgi:hypothetical protein